jgi:hypothetical protein
MLAHARRHLELYSHRYTNAAASDGSRVAVGRPFQPIAKRMEFAQSLVCSTRAAKSPAGLRGSPSDSVPGRDYPTGTVTRSESVESSNRLMVAVVNDTSVTVAVHIGFGHDPAGAVGAFVLTVYGDWPFRGVGNGPDDPAAVNEKL